MANTASIGGMSITDGVIQTTNSVPDAALAGSVSGSKLADAGVTNAKLANMAQGTVKGRAAGAGTGAPTDRTDAQLKTDMAFVKADVGLGNCDNTSDANKPVSTATQTALDAKEGLTCIARAAGAAVAINSTSVVQIASKTNTVAAGDTFSFYLSGYILQNAVATPTYTVRITIGATTFDLAFDATIAQSATNLSFVQAWAEVCVISTSSIGCTIRLRRGVPAGAGTAQNDVLAQDRSVVRTSTNNETGSKTIGIGILSTSTGATQTLTVTRAEVLKGAAI